MEGNRQDKASDNEALRRDMTDIRNLINKTDNLVMNLSSEIKGIQKKQEMFYKRSFFNSVFTYAIFVVVIGFLSYKGFDMRVQALDRERVKLQEELNSSSSEVKRLSSEIQGRDAIEKGILDMLTLIEENRKEEAAEKMLKVNTRDLSNLQKKILGDRINEIKGELLNKFLEKAKDNIGARKLDFADENLKKSLQFVTTDDDMARVALVEASFYTRKGDSAKAEETLLSAKEKYASSPKAPEICYALGNLYEQLGRKKDAVATYVDLYRKYPASPFSKSAARRLKVFQKEGTSPSQPSTVTQPSIQGQETSAPPAQ